MAAREPDDHLTWYVTNYYGGLMTRAERLAYGRFVIEGKIERGSRLEHLLPLLPDDPEALALMRKGVQPFLRQVRDRILREHADRVFLNYCRRCGGLAKTPKARQCRWCFYDWHHDEEPA